MQNLLRLVFAGLLPIALLVSANAVFAAEQKSVLITGASTGIGRNLAETLAGRGYHVYAGARKDQDLADLDAIENITAIRLDVTKQEQIDAAVEKIKNTDTGLYGLINNAGVGGYRGQVVEADIADQTFVYSVNVEGVYRTTKAFAPFVMASKGRIVTTGSIAGTLSSIPGFSAYSGSKHWIEAYTDSLATEMAPHDVHVSVVEPGNYKSNIRRNGMNRTIDQAISRGDENSADLQREYAATAETELAYKEPDEVSTAFMHALFDDKPLRRYVVVPNPDEQELTISTKIAELTQLNQWGPYSYSRDELVEMLDAALKEYAPIN